MTVQVNVSEDEKYPFYPVMFREDLREWEDDDDFEPNAELTDDEVADLRRVQAEHAAWQEKLAKIHEVIRRKQIAEANAESKASGGEVLDGPVDEKLLAELTAAWGDMAEDADG